MIRVKPPVLILLGIITVCLLLSLALMNFKRPQNDSGRASVDNGALKSKQLSDSDSGSSRKAAPESSQTQASPKPQFNPSALKNVWEEAEYQSQYFCERLFPVLESSLPPLYVLKKDANALGVSAPFYAYSNVDIVSQHILNGKGWDNERIQMLVDELEAYRLKHQLEKHQVTFIDIGTNVGWFSYLIARLGYHVISFEPLPMNEVIIRMNMCLWDPKRTQKNWVFLNKGLGAKPSHCKMVSGDENFGDAFTVCDGEPMPPNFYHFHERGSMDVVRLDDVLPASELKKLNIGVVKMDVENYEKFVVMGGADFFSSPYVNRMTLEFFALNPTQEMRSRNQYVYDYLTKYGWKLSDQKFGGSLVKFDSGRFFDGYAWKD